MMHRFKLVVATAPNAEEAEALAKDVVGKKLAGCVNIVPKIRSVYRWRDKVEVDREALMLIKTDAKHLEKLRKRLKKLHSYEVPEILVFDIDEGDADYLKWLKGTLF